MYGILQHFWTKCEITLLKKKKIKLYGKLGRFNKKTWNNSTWLKQNEAEDPS